MFSLTSGGDKFVLQAKTEALKPEAGGISEAVTVSVSSKYPIFLRFSTHLSHSERCSHNVTSLYDMGNSATIMQKEFFCSLADANMKLRLHVSLLPLSTHAFSYIFSLKFSMCCFKHQKSVKLIAAVYTVKDSKKHCVFQGDL